MKFKRGISLALALAILSGMSSPLGVRAAAANEQSAAGSDALAALGIDTSKAPDGFDKNDTTSNPYGRSTIKVTPVYELYTVGLTNDFAPSEQNQKLNLNKKQELQHGDQTVSENTDKGNTLQSTLYGHEDYQSTTAAGLMENPKTPTGISGKTTTTGTYAEISVGDPDGSNEYSTNGYLTGVTNATTTLTDGTSYAMADVAAGHFASTDGNVKSSQIAMVYAGSLNASGGLYLRFGDAVNGQYGKPKTLLDTDKQIGNPTLTEATDDNGGTGALVENFAENPYQLKNYLQVATGDWNNDGLDEVAVYVPEVGHSRIEVFAIRDAKKSYSDPDNWGSAWTYYFQEGKVVSNMISIVSGDVNQDGIDDLACTWGYYYGPNQNAGSRAVVMFGAKGDQLLKQSQEFGLDYNGSNLVRASFAFGDMTGGGKSLILCAQSDADLKAGRQNTRYVALYNWDGSKFTSSVYNNFDLFAKQKKKNSDEEEYVNGAMADHGDVFHSLPLCPANTAIISRPTKGEIVGNKRKTSDLLYFDSLIISCDEGGLAIKQARDNMNGMPGANGEDYVEYSAAAGALTGANGAGTLFTLTQTMSKDTEKTAEKYRAKGEIQVPHYAEAYYYKNWFAKLFKRKTWYSYIDHYEKQTVDQDYAEIYNQRSAGTTRRSMINLFDDNSVTTEKVNSSYALCLANTDDDTSYMTYTGKHDYVYSDPQVLAVLASPPYFSDLLDRDDLSGNYAESTTTYSKSSETESGSTTSTTLSIGAYVSFEQEFSVFGVKIGQAEAEAQYTAGFTWETEHTTSLEQSIEYGASSGEDKVAFYSIPMEIYEYNSYLPDGKGGYNVIKSTVSIPHEASIGLLGLSEYEAIAEDYSVLPSISGSALTHTIGDPSSYPSEPYANSLSYQGTPSKVGFTSKAGGDTLTQSITFTESNSKSYSTSNSVETKAGAGAGGLTVGVVAGSENSAGKVEVSTAGSSFTGSLQQMPAEAQPYHYGMNWRIFCYNYRQGSLSFPVVTYAVSDVQAPSPLPEEFEQNVSETTEHSVTLDWSYDKIVSGFNLYRYYYFPDGSGRELIDFIPFAAGERDAATGTYSFSYTDGNKENNTLSPYTEYEYQIQTVNYNNANCDKSIYSEPLSCYTKTTLGYPKISVNGEYKDCTLPIYPDTQSTATIGYDAPSKSQGEYRSVSFQWQKLNGSKWEDLSGSTDSTLRIANAGSGDKGTYRCRLNILYWDISSQKQYSISAYSPEVKAEYSKRTPAYDLRISDENVQDGDRLNRTLHISADLSAKASIGSTSSSKPTGTVTFLVKGKNFSASLAAAIGEDGKATAQDLVVPEDGAYSISLYYPGSYVFKGIDGSDSKMYIVGKGTGYQLALSKKNGTANDNLTRFTYGDIVQPTLTKMTDNESKPDTLGGARFEYAVSGSTDKQSLPDKALPVGSYTLYAYDGSTLAAETAFTVVPREVTLRVQTPEHGISQDGVQDSTGSVTGISFTSKDMTADEIDALHLTYTAVNSAGNEETLKNGIAPSNYTITPCKSAATDDALYNNYTFTFIPGIYWVKGLTYVLTLEAVDYGEGADKHAVASASIITAGGTATEKTDKGMKASFAAQTEVQMQVIPDPGYAVDHWEYAGSKIKDSEGNTVVSVTTLAKDAAVKVYFKTAQTELKVQASNANGGTVKCTDENGTEVLKSYPAYISNGTSFFFTAVPAEGWHFKQWNRRESNASTYPTGTKNDDGSNTLEMEIGARNVTLIAEFERDKYKLTLDGELTASYTRTKEDETTEIVPIASGESVPGDTVITVAPKAGYTAAEGKTYQVDTIPANMTNGTIKDGKYIFAIQRNTTISLETTRLAFTVDAQADKNGTVSVLADGQTRENKTQIEGGSEVQIKAHANRGWHFDHWEVDGKPVTGENAHSDVYTVKELDGNLTIKAVFAQSKSYTATANVVAANRGEMQYTLYDIYGEEVPTDSKVMPEGGVTIYENEQISFRVVPKTGFSVEKWFVNGMGYTQHSNTNPGGKLTATDKLTVNGKITATVHLQTAASYYTYYAVSSKTPNGALTATADGTAFSSGSLLSNGSALVFTATPSNGKMVEKWTVTNGDLNAKEDETAVSIEPVFPHTLDGNTSVRVYFTDYAANTVSVTNGTAGTGKLTYTTPIQPNEDGKLADTPTSAPVRTNGTVKLTLTPGTNYVGTANEVQSNLQALAGDDSAVTVTENDGAFEVEIRNVTKEITIDPADLFHATYEVKLGTFANGTVTASAARAKAGDTVTLTVAPAGNYQLSTLTLTPETKLNEAVSTSTLKYTFTMPANDVSVAAVFTEKPKQPSGGGTGGGSIGGGGAGGGGGAAPAPSGSTSIVAADGTKITADVKISSGTASVTADSTKLRGKDSFTLDLTADKTVHTVSLSGSTVSAMADAKNGTELILPTGSITLDRDTLTSLASAAKTDGTIRISVKSTESTALNDAQRKLMPKGGTLLDAAAYTQSANGAQSRVHELNGYATITVPYQLGQNESAAHLVAYYLAENGSFEKLPVSYNAKTGMASFKTTHFSTFVVAHEYSSDFTDVALNSWFYNEVNTALANGWFKGTSNTAFSPNTGMTRAMLVQVLYRMNGGTATANDKFSDVTADKWYAEAIAWASENGIVTGYADGTFKPDAQVTRQQLAAILYRYDAFTGHTPTANTSLDAFTDAASVESWAADAMRWANGTGLVTGVTPTTLVPNGTATRAQVAVILTRYTGK